MSDTFNKMFPTDEDAEWTIEYRVEAFNVNGSPYRYHWWIENAATGDSGCGATLEAAWRNYRRGILT